MKTTLNPGQWVEEYASILFKFTVSRIGDGDTAKDLVQDTFLSALKNTGTFRGEVSEKNWLFAILKNKIIDHYRGKAKSHVTSLHEHLEKESDYFDEYGDWQQSARPQHWAVDYSQDIEKKDFYAILEACKGKLNELQNIVFTMKYLDDIDSEDICKELNISSSNYWVLIHRAKLQIRHCLEKNWFKI